MSLSHPTIRAQGESEITREGPTGGGLTIAVEPITWENASRFTEIYRTFALETPRGTEQVQGSVIPLPAFRVTVTNHTGHVVRFTQSIIRLSDDLQRQYQPIATTGELLAWAQGDSAAAIAAYPSFGTQIAAAVGQLRLFSRNVELLNGDSTPYYLVFSLPGSSNPDDPTHDYRALLESLRSFRLRIAEVPIGTDEAGQVARTEEFQFDFNRSEYPQAVTCRGSREPSWNTCAME